MLGWGCSLVIELFPSIRPRVQFPALQKAQELKDFITQAEKSLKLDRRQLSTFKEKDTKAVINN